ncbi:MAG: type II methionyl aminopeptidase [Candidatus Woesearchaeota archaeon]
MNEATKQDYLQAGKIVAQGLALGRELIKAEKNILEILLAIEQHILDSGAEIAFPAQISINETAAHDCAEPNDKKILQEGDLVKLDIGAHINGRIADAAITIDLSTDNKHKKLIQAAEQARDAAVEMARPGVSLGEIGKTIQDIITQAGYAPVRNLGGHGLGEYEVHTEPRIPNINTKDETVLEEGMIIAIEPFASTGEGIVHEQEYGNIYSFSGKARVRGRYAREALKHIQTRNGLPFSLHWLAKQMGEGPARFGLKEIYQAGEALTVYPPLVDKKESFVAQAEHSVIVAEEPIVYTKQ